MTSAANQLLTAQQTRQKIRRMAYEVYENNFLEQGMVLAGVCDKGYQLAELLRTELAAISPLRIALVRVDFDKQRPLQSPVALDCPPDALRHQCIVLLDDVLNTGRTLAHSLRPFLELEIKKLQTAVLVRRHHARFPVAADYVGYSLATTLSEHVEVVLDDTEAFGVYLS